VSATVDILPQLAETRPSVRAHPRLAAMEHLEWRYFYQILILPDNVPIVIMLFIFIAAIWVSIDQAVKNDRLIEEGRRDEILRRMQD
jgi:hypothetical protein